MGFVDETFEVSQLYEVLPATTTDPGPGVSSTKTGGCTFPPVAPTVAAPITDQREAFYLARYTDIIGPRFDMFDSTCRYFSLVLPHIALRNRLVLLACMASAARQYSLVTNRGHHDALAYYNEAIKALSDHLSDSGHEAATFASCLLIAHCEMVESKASDWILHLKGTGELMALHNWDGRSGGLAQAVRVLITRSPIPADCRLKSFWIYCRMMILASLSSGTPAAVNLGQLLSLGQFPDPREWTLDGWQNRVVYLLGSVQHFWARTRLEQELDRQEELTAEWLNLSNELLRHENQAPAMCRALSITAPTEENPFETVRYINGPVSAAWQMLHTAYLVLTLSQPTSPATRLSLLSSPGVARNALLYARRIVSNSIANRCPIAWANAVQLLTVAGLCLLEAKEREACLRALDDIQHHTGWDTRANMQRLSTAWSPGLMAVGGTRPTMDIGSRDRSLGVLLYNVWKGDEVAMQLEQVDVYQE